MGGDLFDRGEDRLHGETSRNWVRQAERDEGPKERTTTDERARRLKALERVAFIDDPREVHGIEPIIKLVDHASRRLQ